MKKVTFFLIAFFFISQINAQQNIYTVFTLPDSLKNNADVITREENIKFIIKDINSARYEVHVVYTIMNEKGNRYLNFNEFSYKFRELDNAEIKVYDASGIKKNTYSKKEMISLNYGEGLVAEGKVTYFNVAAPSYPLTVEINYSINYKGLFNYPGNYFQFPNQSIQHAVFEIEVPTALSLRYKILNCNYLPAITKNGAKDFYKWEIKNLIAYKLEEHSGSSDNYLPQIILAPNKFKLDDYEGDMTSWKNFGEWYNKVYQKTSELKEERKLFYQNLVKAATTEKEKASILYSYMQNNMRYVSIQLGIGGLRPFSAGFVDEKKYGDCKALSNFLKSALDAVNIKSNVVIIEAGMNPVNIPEDFPAHYFNHVILCIPQPKDSIWLECTSTTLPFAQLGAFTENRKAMMITEKGGVLVKTPKSGYKNNTQSFFTDIKVDDNGAAKITFAYTSQGEARDYLLAYFHDIKEDEKIKYIVRSMQWKQPDIMQIATSFKTDNRYVVNASMEYDKIYSFKTGSKYFLEPRLHPVWDEDIPETDKRTKDYYFTYPYQYADTTVYHFDAAFDVESLPKDKELNFSFAVYNSSFKWDKPTNTLTIITLLQIKERIIKASDYQKLLHFKKQVMVDVNDKIVMQKK